MSSFSPDAFTHGVQVISLNRGHFSLSRGNPPLYVASLTWPRGQKISSDITNLSFLLDVVQWMWLMPAPSVNNRRGRFDSNCLKNLMLLVKFSFLVIRLVFRRFQPDPHDTLFASVISPGFKIFGRMQLKTLRNFAHCFLELGAANSAP